MSEVLPLGCSRYSDELIAAFIDGNLGPEEREYMLFHLGECQQCFERVNKVLESRRRVSDPSVGHDTQQCSQPDMKAPGPQRNRTRR